MFKMLDANLEDIRAWVDEKGDELRDKIQEWMSNENAPDEDQIAEWLMSKGMSQVVARIFAAFLSYVLSSPVPLTAILLYDYIVRSLDVGFSSTIDTLEQILVGLKSPEVRESVRRGAIQLSVGTPFFSKQVKWSISGLDANGAKTVLQSGTTEKHRFTPNWAWMIAFGNAITVTSDVTWW